MQSEHRKQLSNGVFSRILNEKNNKTDDDEAMAALLFLFFSLFD